MHILLASNPCISTIMLLVQDWIWISLAIWYHFHWFMAVASVGVRGWSVLLHNHMAEPSPSDRNCLSGQYKGKFYWWPDREREILQHPKLSSKKFLWSSLANFGPDRKVAVLTSTLWCQSHYHTWYLNPQRIAHLHKSRRWSLSWSRLSRKFQVWTRLIIR